jgi:steroid 5-alpha reductase family enzyme
MAIPTLKSIKDCADYSITLEPYLPQLYSLPARLWAVRGLGDLKHVYIDTNPLMMGVGISVALAAVFLVVSEVNKNYSQVDRMWSILPNLYIVHMAIWARLNDLPNSRLLLVASAFTLWSFRLTFNYWRRGGYNVGSEDYRWVIVKGYLPGPLWFIFNVTFISLYQSLLLFAFAGPPAYVILLTTQFEPNVTAGDIFYFLIEVGLVVSEFISDGQQYTYQNAKHQYYKDAQLPPDFSQAELDRGFRTSGLWAYSRHPNFFAEQAIWFMLYQWSCFASNSLYHWAGAGAGALILLFQGSTWLTEAITANKYPEYKEYQKQVGMFMPMSLKGYQTPALKQPKVIRTSELAKRQESKKQK